MDKISFPQELEGAGKLLQEMASYDLVQTRVQDIWIFSGNIMRSRVCDQLLSLLDEQRQVPQLTVFHNEIDMRARLDAIMESNDMRVPKGLENLNFAIEIFLQLLVQTGKLDRLDGYQSTSDL
jgi:hypothetical protein